MNAPDEKMIGIAIIGALEHARAWLAAYRDIPGVRIVGVFDPVREHAARLAESVEGALVFSSIEELMTHPDVVGAEICLPPGEAVPVAAQCLSSGLAVGIRGVSVTSLQDVVYLLEHRKGKTPIRLFSPALYYPPIELARRDLRDGEIGDIQTMRIRSILGRNGRSDDILVRPAHSASPDFCEPQYEALPLMFLLGEVQSVHVDKAPDSAVIGWVSERTEGGSKFGVYEAVRAEDIFVRGPLDPLDESFEIAGTDGYLFGARLTGYVKDAPAYSRYIGDVYDAPCARVEDDPMSSYRAAALEFAESAKDGVSVLYGWKWVQMIGLLREAIRESLRTGLEVPLAHVEKDYRQGGYSVDWKGILGLSQLKRS